MLDYAKVIAWKTKERAKFADVLASPPKKRKQVKVKGKAEKVRRQRRPSEYFPVHNKAAYRRYLTTRHWRKRRAVALKVLGGKCDLCGRPLEKPQVHHKHYRTLWRERPKDLQILCRGCHELHHLGVTGADLQHLKACAAGL